MIFGLVVLSGISSHVFYLQSAWVAMASVILLSSVFISWRPILSQKTVVWGIYGFIVALLLIAYFTSPVIRNTRSWIMLGPLGFQPVEFAKIALILVYAHYFSRRHLAVARWKNIFISFLLFVLPAGITLLLPDLGSAMILFGIWFGFLLVSGLPRQRVVAAFAVFAIIGIIGWNFALEKYQKDRIRGVFYPEENVLTVNYSVIQAKIAIGSAGFWGKGYGQGSQTQLGFLTEPTNDFILAAAVEEWGLAVGIAIIGSLLALIWNILKIGIYSRANFEKFLALGTAMVLGLHFIINAGSTIGLLPVVGVPFPFLSSGGSNLLTSSFLLAIINSIARRA